MVELYSTTPSIKVFYKAFSLPAELVMTEKPFLLRGCLYDFAGKKIRASERVSGVHGDFFKLDNPDNIDFGNCSDIKKVTGKSIYLGHYMAHYGHFVTEMISTMWPLLHAHEFDHYVFHEFVWGRKLTSYIKTLFQIFNIPIEKVLFVDKVLQFEELWLPERLISLNRSANIAVRSVYDRIKENAAIASHGKRIYLSRVENSKIKIGRAVINEALLQAYLQANGFEIIYPEKLPFSEQIALFLNADIVIGFSGTALHNCVFMKKRSIVIELGDNRSGEYVHPMQEILNLLAEVKSSFIPFDGFVLDSRNHIGIVFISSTIAKIAIILNHEVIQKKHLKTSKFFRAMQTTLHVALVTTARLLKLTVFSNRSL